MILVIKTTWIYQNSYKNQLKVMGKTYLDIYFLQIERMAIQRTNLLYAFFFEKYPFIVEH